MGCDIHVSYEIRQPDGSWQLHDHTAPYKRGKVDADGDQEIDYDKLWQDPLELGRHYRFFAFLADVRNGSGFAGVDTGDEVTPIDEPRGVPADASEDYQAEVEHWNGDGHSHSFFTAEELVNADWDQTTVERGYISLTDYPRFKEQGNMDNMASCGGVDGRNVIKLTPEFADDLLADPAQVEAGKSYYVQVEYACPLREELSSYLETWLPTVLKLHEDPSCIRMVFFFDN